MPLFLWPAQPARVCERHSWPLDAPRISRVGAAGWETADCVQLFQGRGWSGTRAVSEVAAKLAGVGTWPHKLRPRLGTRQHRLGCGCEGKKLNYLLRVQGWKGSQDTETNDKPYTSYLSSVSPPLYRHAASALTPGLAQVSMPVDELEAGSLSHFQPQVPTSPPGPCLSIHWSLGFCSNWRF